MSLNGEWKRDEFPGLSWSQLMPRDDKNKNHRWINNNTSSSTWNTTRDSLGKRIYFIHLFNGREMKVNRRRRRKENLRLLWLISVFFLSLSFSSPDAKNLNLPGRGCGLGLVGPRISTVSQAVHLTSLFGRETSESTLKSRSLAWNVNTQRRNSSKTFNPIEWVDGWNNWGISSSSGLLAQPED